MIERSLVLLKPDAVQRGIVGEIIHRIERTGLKMLGAKLIKVDEAHGAKHYGHSHNDTWYAKVGNRNLDDCKNFNLDVMDIFGTDDPIEIGKLVDKRNAEFLSMGPVFAIVFEGPNAISRIRTLVGDTFPSTSPAGTIRGDYGLDSAYSGMIRKRTSYNMIHASGSVEESAIEIKLWFKDDELFSYRRVHEDLYNY